MIESDNWQVLDSRIKYQAHFEVVQDHLRKPTGDEMIYNYINSKCAAAILAFTTEGKVIVTRQYRHPIRKTIYDLPAGGIISGETSEQAVRRELKEETGYRVKEISLLGSFYPSPGMHASKIDVYLANEAEPGNPNPDENEIIEIELMDWQDVVGLVQSNQSIDVTLAYAVMRYGMMNQSQPNPACRGHGSAVR